MRMWNEKLISCLCCKHLLGMHGEIHKHRHNFIKKHNMTGRIGQIEPEYMEIRHNQLAVEMLNRGYNHNSPYEQPDISYLPDEVKYSRVDYENDKNDLISRCEKCKTNLKNKEGREL